MNYEPTEAEFRGLLRVLGEFPLSWKLTDQIARRILRHYEPRMREQRIFIGEKCGHLNGNNICCGEKGHSGLHGNGIYVWRDPPEHEPTTPPVAPITIALDDRTLRALMAAMLTQQWTSAALNRADVILAEIDKAKEESK